VSCCVSAVHSRRVDELAGRPTTELRSRPQRVLPAQAREAGEIAVGRAEDEAVLDGESGQMGVADEVGARGGEDDQWRENGAMAVRRGGNPHRWTIEPPLDLPPGIGDRHRLGKDARTGNQANEA